ncbi:MAG TPA: transposase, partial [Methylocella sp.]|nr:transposase [Methylocella sp.]
LSATMSASSASCAPRPAGTRSSTPEPIKDWSLTTLKEKLIKIGAKIVSHGRYVTFQMAEVAIPKTLFADILQLIAELRPPPAALNQGRGTS